MIASLVGMRNDIKRLSQESRISLSDSIEPFDIVLVGEDKCIGLVEEKHHGSYHVVFRNKLGHPVHGVYIKNQLQKVKVINSQSIDF